MGKNMDEADQAVMKAERETGFSETPVQMEMDLAAPKAKPVQNTQEQVYNLETRLYDLNNVIRQEGGVMSKTNLQKINKEINEIQSKLNKLQGYKNGGIVQNSVDYALEQWT
jgi:polyhydroxyalkanoate synthesis regulator phasin